MLDTANESFVRNFNTNVYSFAMKPADPTKNGTRLISTHNPVFKKQTDKRAPMRLYPLLGCINPISLMGLSNIGYKTAIMINRFLFKVCDSNMQTCDKLFSIFRCLFLQSVTRIKREKNMGNG